MLRRRPRLAHARRAAQRGVVLLVAIVVLVAITVAAIAMIRSVDTATLVAGNLAFQQSATQATDKGIEAAVAMLRAKATAGTLDAHDNTVGYFATLRVEDNPAAGQSWREFWADSLAGAARFVGEDTFKNKIYYVVHRQCANAAPPGAGGECVTSPAVTSSRGGDEESGAVQISAANQIYYRVTVRVLGPRRTESYVQSHISM